MDGYEEWDFVQVLGEGAYGEVKLAVSNKTQEQLAVKIIGERETVTNPCLDDALSIRSLFSFLKSLSD